MALCYTRILYQRSFCLNNIRKIYCGSLLKTAVTKPVCLASTICETHDEKNIRLKRPMSPHLTIYQIQLTTLLSITHRTTGIILATYAMALSFGTLLVPGGVPCMIEIVESWCLPASVLFVGKSLLALPATYHTFNGIRHLCWDLGKFLTIREVYSTGYAVVGLSVLSALGLAAM